MLPMSPLLLQPVALSLDEEHVAVVKEPVEDRRGEHLVPENCSPLGDYMVGGNQHAATSLVAECHQLEEQMGPQLLAREVSELVDDEQLRLRIERELLGELPLRLRLGERRKERGRAGEEYGAAASITARPMAMARWVLPTPGGPKRRTFTPLAMKRPVQSSRTSLSSTEGWNLNTKVSRVFTAGRSGCPW